MEMLAFAAAAEAVRDTGSKLEKVRRLAEFLRGLEEADLPRAVTWMTGRALPPTDPRVLNLGWAAVNGAVEQLSGLDQAELGAAYRRHMDPGDWAFEVLEDRTAPEPVTLAEVAQAIDAIEAAGSTAAKQDALVALLRRLEPRALRFVVKILAGDLRIGLREGLVEEAIAQAFESTPAAVRRVHMLTGDLAATAVLVRRGEVDTAGIELFKPLRFMLASPVATPEEAMARVSDRPAWVEEKYDGVRCQLHLAGGRVALFSRDLRETTAAFPEIAEAAAAIDRELVLDGEVLGFRDGRVLRFGELQRRLGRRVVSAKLRAEVPLALVVFDLLHLDGEALLDLPLRERRARLEALGLRPPLLLARREEAADAETLERIFGETRARGNEGLMLKSPESAYTPGRRGLGWLKLKRPLATLDVAVTAVEWGHGRRKDVLSDYTFAVLDTASGELVEVGKAYRGLTDAEIAEMTRHFLAATVEDQGWRRRVRPDTVIEVAFDAIQRSSRHRGGFALRFPRIVRLRPDKAVAEIDTLATVADLHDRFFGPVGAPRFRGPHES